VVGPNGSGKSLLAAAISAVFSTDDGLASSCEDLRAAGVERIEVFYTLRGAPAHLLCDTAAAERRIEWEPVPPDAQQPPALLPRNGGVHESPSDLPSFDLGELFQLVHVVRSGRPAISADAPLTDAVIRAVCAPLRRELSGWRSREADLCGTAEKTGRLAVARRTVDAAEEEFARVKRLWDRAEEAKTRQQALAVRALELDAHGKVAALEIEELTRMHSLASRAARLEDWMNELAHESSEVESLRHRHEELQSRLDVLDERFRGTPDTLPELAQRHAAARARERQLNDQLTEIRSAKENAQAELDQLERELDEVGQPRDAVSFDADADREREAIGEALGALLRRRIDLVRLREGIEHQAEEFAPFAALDDETRTALDRLANGDGTGSEHLARPLVDHQAVAQREKRVRDVLSVLRERYAGYESFGPGTPELLRELHDLRRVRHTLEMDVLMTRKRRSALQRQAHPLRSILWGVAAGAVGFAAGTALAGWDIGLFAGVACSGLALLAVKFLHRGVDVEMESAHAAEEMILHRLTETRDAISHLERALGPLAPLAALDEALSRFMQYRRLREELDVLTTSAQSEGESQQAGTGDGWSALRTRLPGPLSDLTRRELVLQYERFQEFEAQSEDLARQWQEFGNGGAQAEEIRRLEDHVRRLETERAQREEEARGLAEADGLRRTMLMDRATELQDQVSDDSAETRIERDIRDVREMIVRIEHESGGLLGRAEGETVDAEWREAASLREQLRQVRSAISQHQTSDELRARELLLADEAALVKAKLEALDPLYGLSGNGADHAVKYGAQLEAAREMVEENQRLLADVQRELDGLDVQSFTVPLAQERSLEDLQREIAAARERLENSERDLQTTRELIASIEAELEETMPTTRVDLAAAVDRHVRVLSDDRFHSLSLSQGRWAVESAEATVRPLTTLSDGMQDLIWLAVRLAVFETVRHCDTSPVIWDEALARLDDHHLERIRQAVVHLATSRQVILLTRQADLQKWGACVHLIEVTPPVNAALRTD